MDLNDQIPIRIRHILETNIPQDTRIIDEHVNPSKVLDGRLDDLVSILDTIVVGNGHSSGGANLIHDLICSLKSYDQ